ncbi:hypothetical protein SK128_003551 [Halocaridina rubra]|uniref:Uncharacterized protein n=1 Tax=Halocaridina rubra TaxID=373956 RepID=A0AAN8WU86_HALRR
MKTNALSKPSKLSHTPAKGPMDVFIGQKTPSPQGKLPVQDYSHQSSSKSGDFSSNLSYLSDSIASSSKTSGYGGSPVSTGVIKTHCGTVGSNIGRQLKEITSLQSSESDSDEMITFTDVSKVRQTNPTGKENISQVERKKAQNSKNKPKIRTPFKGKDKSEIESPKKTLQEPFVTRTRAISLDLDVDMNTDNAESIIFAENGNDTYTDNDPDYEISGCCNRVKSYCCNQKETHLKKNNVREKSVVEASEPVEGVCTLEESNEGEQNSSMDYGLFFEDLGLQNMEKFKEEQIKLEEQIEQEKADRLLAEMIQKQFYQEVGRSNVVNFFVNNDFSSGLVQSFKNALDTLVMWHCIDLLLCLLEKIDRSRGSEDEYALRNRRPAATSASKASPVSRKSGKRERQTTIDESMAKRCKNR